MQYHFFSYDKGPIIFVLMITVVAFVLANIITCIIIQFSTKGNLPLGLFIASFCSLAISPPISWYIFQLLKKLHESRNNLQATNLKLEKALKDVSTLTGLLPICSKCKKVRDNEGYWKQIESYIESHSDVLFSHGLCEHCLEDLYGDKLWFNREKK